MGIKNEITTGAYPKRSSIVLNTFYVGTNGKLNYSGLLRFGVFFNYPAFLFQKVHGILKNNEDFCPL